MRIYMVSLRQLGASISDKSGCSGCVDMTKQMRTGISCRTHYWMPRDLQYDADVCKNVLLRNDNCAGLGPWIIESA